MPGNVGVVKRDAQGDQQALHSSQDPHLDPLITLPSQPEERHFAVLAHYLNKDMQQSAAEQVNTVDNGYNDTLRGAVLHVSISYNVVF